MITYEYTIISGEHGVVWVDLFRDVKFETKSFYSTDATLMAYMFGSDMKKRKSVFDAAKKWAVESLKVIEENEKWTL